MQIVNKLFGSRKRKVITATVALSLVAAVVWAAVVFVLPASGRGNVVAPANVRIVSVTEVGSTGLVDCQASLIPGPPRNSAEINLIDSEPGNDCSVDIGIQRIGRATGNPFFVGSFKLFQETEDRVSAADCGVLIAQSPAITVVRVVLTVPLSAVAGDFTVQSSAGLDIQDVAGQPCPTA